MHTMISLYKYLMGRPSRWDAFKVLTIKGYMGRVKHDDLYCPHMTRTKSIFIHIPKTAGQSASISLYGEVRSGHQLWRNYYVADKKAFRNYFKFAFVRDPVSRFRSAYYYLKSGGYGPVDKGFGDNIIGRYRDINEFAIEWLSTKNAYSWIHMIPQHEFICNDNGSIMVDYLGRFETLESDFMSIANKVNPGASLAEFNQTSYNELEILSEEAIGNIKQVYNKDYQYLGYDS